MIEKANYGETTSLCLRNGCGGIKPRTLHRPSLTAAMCVVMDLCDHCDKPVRPDVNGYYCGLDGLQDSDCSASPRGHEVGGETYR